MNIYKLANQKIILFLLAFLILIFAQSVIASRKDSFVDIYSNLDHSISFDITGLSLHYKEFKKGNTGPILDTSRGAIIGYSLLFRSAIGPINSEIGYNYNKGYLKYEQQHPYIPHSYKHRIYSYYAQLSYPFQLKSSRIYPLIRIGYREWFRGMDAINIKTHYPEYYNNYFWLIGLGWTKLILPRLLFDIKLMYGRTFNGTITTPNNNVVILPLLKLGNSNIYSVQTKLYYTLTNHLSLNTFINYVNFKFGETKEYQIPGTSFVGFREPNSVTNQFTLGLGITYKW